MGTSERRAELLRILSLRRHDTVINLAREFGVSERTIRRDIDALSLSEPIYTQTGRYNGGVYIVEGYSVRKLYMLEAEIKVIEKIRSYFGDAAENPLTSEEMTILNSIVSKYTKPKLTEKTL